MRRAQPESCSCSSLRLVATARTGRPAFLAAWQPPRESSITRAFFLWRVWGGLSLRAGRQFLKCHVIAFRIGLAPADVFNRDENVKMMPQIKRGQKMFNFPMHARRCKWSAGDGARASSQASRRHARQRFGKAVQLLFKVQVLDAAQVVNGFHRDVAVGIKKDAGKSFPA